jgi:glycosyltransferase involved in cell wall biosynthesis
MDRVMRIGIDASSIDGDKGGVGWHTYHLLRSLLAEPDELEYVGYLRSGTLRGAAPEGWDVSARIRWVEVPRWQMRWRGRWDRLDLYHGPNFKIHTAGRYGAVVTIHDLWLVRHPEYSKKVFGQAGSTRRARERAGRARSIITVSEFSAAEIEQLYDIPRDRIVVIYNGVSEAFAPVRDERTYADIRQRFDLPAEGFLLFVGGADPRKNHRGFLEAIAQIRERLRGRALVLVGDPEHPEGSYRRTAAEFGLEASTRCPGRLQRRDLCALYSQADAFVFPSLYEGFGMPVLEAMACGAPTITSSTSALPEVAGKAALLVDPSDPSALARAILRVLDEPDLRARLRADGFERARQFTWRSAALQTAALYRRLCA